MARSLKSKRQKRTQAQLNNMHRAIGARWEFKHGDIRSEEKMELEAQVEEHKLNVVLYKNKYWSEHRKNHCQKKAYENKKIDHKRIKEEAYRMRGAFVML